MKHHIKYDMKDTNLSSLNKHESNPLFWKCKIGLLGITSTVRRYYEYKDTILDEYQDIPKHIQTSALLNLQK